MNEVRIDKWMWATRIFKTRTIAAEACKKNRVMINGVNVKPSRMIKVGEVIQARKPPITFSFKVLDLTERRMGAKLSGKRHNSRPIRNIGNEPHIRIRRPCTWFRPSDQKRPSRTGTVYRSRDDERWIRFRV